MNIEDIESKLPNGLHDAVLTKFVVDYEDKVASLFFDIWVGDLDSKHEEERELYKSGILYLRDLKYFVVEPPDSEVKLKLEPFSSSAGNPEVEKIKPCVKLPDAPEGTFKAYFFLYLLNSFIHVCASEVEFTYAT